MTSFSKPLRVFVMGCSRGGTTLTQRLVAERLGLYTLPETRFFASMIGNTEARMFPTTARPIPGIKRITSRLREALGRSTGMEYNGLSVVEAPDRRRWVRFGPRSQEFITLLDELATSQDLAGWLEKTPFHVLYARDIQRLVPDAWMVHVVRDARETVASLWDASQRYPDSWGRNYADVTRAVDNWNASTRASAAMVGQQRQVFIPYAALARHPQAAMDIMARQMGLGAVAPTGGMQAPVGLAGSREHWKADALSGEVRPATSKWMTALSEADRARAEPLIEPVPAALTQGMAAFADLIPEPGQ